MDPVFERGLPSNVDAERFCLGSVMLNDTNWPELSGVLDPESFTLEKHRRIFARMKDLADRGEHIDRVTLANELMRLGQLESIDGISYLVSLDQGLPELTNLSSYIGIVREKYALRCIIFDAQRRINQALSDMESKDIAAAGVATLQGIQRGQDKKEEGRTPEQIVTEFPGGINAFLDPTQRVHGLPTGFLKFDEYTVGLHAGELTVLGARPGVGKSAWLANVMAHICLHPKQRKAASLFSLEMTAAALLTRIMCGDARVDQHKFRAGFLNADERRRLQIGLDNIINSRLKIYDKFGITMPEIEQCIRRDVDENACSLVGIDYLQLIGIKKKGERRDLDLGEITRRLKVICGPDECNIPIIILSQLSRAGDKRTGGSMQPILSDLRESGNIEQDCDNVLFLDREELRKRDREDLRGLADLIIAKQRNGACATVKLRFIGPFLRFENCSEDLTDNEEIPGMFVS